jgi:Regulator of chromosome condensation (RCC1) repeat
MVVRTISKKNVDFFHNNFVLRKHFCHRGKSLYLSGKCKLTAQRGPLQQSSPYQIRNQHTVVYAVGEGWTGALGTGRIDQSILGQSDDDDYQSIQDSNCKVPVLLYDTSATNEEFSQRLLSCSVGWGHTALIVEETATPTVADGSESMDNDRSETSTTSTKLLLTGRPHEFASLLRLQRLPRMIRNFMTYHTYNTIRRANIIETSEELKNNDTISLNPIDMIGNTLTFLSKLFGNPQKDPDWNAARDQSYLIVPTSIPLPFDTTRTSSSSLIQFTTDNLPNVTDPRAVIPNDIPVHVTCNAGTTAITTEKGYVYTFGLNGIGQCGTGDLCNNVWIPSRVTGLSREFSATGYRATTLPQSYAIQQTCLGLQRTFAYIVQYHAK